MKRITLISLRVILSVFAALPLTFGALGLISCHTPDSSPTGSGGGGGGSGKKITTYAGNGTLGASGDNGPALQAELNGPCGIKLDSIGYLYIADNNNSEIRVVDTTSAHKIFTAAGTGSPGYNGDNISPTAATLNKPTDVAVDASGNIFVADEWNDRIRKISAIITTAAGTGIPTYSGDGAAATLAAVAFPTGVSFDKSGNLYIADQGNNRIRVINAATGNIATVAGNGITGPIVDGGQAATTAITSPYYAIVDSSGNIYISQPGMNVVRKVDTGGVITTYAGTGTANYTGDGKAATAATLYYPTGLALDSSGNLYIADSRNNVIREVTASTGIISTVVGTGTPGFSADGTTATSAQLNTPIGIAFDSSGTLYLADFGNNVVRVVK